MLKKILLLGALLGLGFVLMVLTTQNSHYAVQSEAVLKQNPRQIWTLLEDVPGWPLWWPGLERAKLDGVLVVGSTVDLGLKGQPDSGPAVLTRIDPLQTLAWQRKGVLGSTAGTEIALQSDGAGCRVQVTLFIDGPQAFLARLTGRDAFVKYQQKLLDSLRVYLDVKAVPLKKKD